MQMQVPKGRANYEPNSLAEAGEEGALTGGEDLAKRRHWLLETDRLVTPLA